MNPPVGPHMDIEQWLTALDLPQYSSVFDKFNGVEVSGNSKGARALRIFGLQDLLGFSESEIKDMGVKNSAHRARIISSLVVLRKKYNKGKS